MKRRSTIFRKSKQFSARQWRFSLPAGLQLPKLKLLAFFAFLFILLFALPQSKFANTPSDTITSVATGDWSDPATWDISTPPENAFVIIAGHSVILNESSRIHSLQIEQNGQLEMLSDLEITDHLEIEGGSTLNLGTHIINGEGNFSLLEAGTLIIGHPEGINHTAASGNILLTGQRDFAPIAVYHYTGAGDQFSGDALPHEPAARTVIIELDSDNSVFRINKLNSVSIEEPGKLEIRSGTLIEPASISQTEGRYIQGTGALVMPGGRYLIENTTTENSDIRFPRLSGSYDGVTGGTIILAGQENFQNLRQNKQYHNLTFSGEGVKILRGPVPNILNTITIENDAVVDARSYALGSAETNFTMTSGRLISNRSGAFPSAAGSWNISGGTIEFSYSGATSQTIRGTANHVYHNIDVTGSNVANSNGNIHIGSGGTFRIHENGSFRIASTLALVGQGNFIMEDNSTLLYAHPNGITTQDAGTAAAAGNIRTLTRSFNPNAIYGFHGGADQQTGNGLPLSVRGIMVRKQNPTNMVYLTRNLTIAENLTLESGILIPEANELYLLNANTNSLTAGTGNENFELSFIAGQLTRGVSTDLLNPYTFPVGKNQTVQTASIQFTSGTITGNNPTLSAEFLDETPDNYYGNLPIYAHGIYINTLAENGYWRIYASEPSDNIVYDLELYAKDFDNIIFPDLISVIKRTDEESDWEQAGTTVSWGGGPLDYWFKAQDITSGFSEFALGSTFQSNPLPVSWYSFTATPLLKGVILRWQTATEINNDRFTILRSANGVNFSQIGTQPGAGNSNNLLEYTFTDKIPLPGISYYRLRQTDFNGEYAYSNILAVELPYDQDIKIFSYNQKLHFHIPAGKGVSTLWNYTIYDLRGQVIRSNRFSNVTGAYHTDISQLRSQPVIIKLWKDSSLNVSRLIFVN